MRNKLNSAAMWLLADPARVRLVIGVVVLTLTVMMVLSTGVVRADNQIIGTGH
jgi:hypothetical protein